VSWLVNKLDSAAVDFGCVEMKVHFFYVKDVYYSYRSMDSLTLNKNIDPLAMSPMPATFISLAALSHFCFTV
jgi:hypothetical protein